MSSLRLHRVELDAFPAITEGLELGICQTPQWLQFLKQSQSAEPVLAEVMSGDQRVGVFVGAIVRRLRFRILGSPLRGWTTSYMGFALQQAGDRTPLLNALKEFAFKQLGCSHLELLDISISSDNYPSGWTGSLLQGYEIDLSKTEDELFGAMGSACRRAIRKAEKSGVTVEVVNDPAGFAGEYYSQLREVFAKDGLAPSYPQRRVEQLIEALHPQGMLLLLRARDVEGRAIATSIFPGYGSGMYFWGGASRRDGLHNRPNEAMMWAAMRWWKSRGVTRFDMGGGGDYKAKYGGTLIAVPWMRCSRNPAIAALRSGAESVMRLKQRLRR